MHQDMSEKATVFFLRSHALWNGFFLFRLGLYTLSITELSPLLFLLGFFLSLLHAAHKGINAFLRMVFAIANIALLYHDSYLPGIKQLLAQKDNLKDFSVDYIQEFLIDFINIKMIIALLSAVIILRLLGLFLRGSTLVLCTFLVVCTLPSDYFQKFTFENDEITVSRNIFSKENGIIPQFGTFTESNLTRYLNSFFDNEKARRVTFDFKRKAKATPFHILILQTDFFSNEDLQKFSADHGGLKGFNIYLTNFNTVATDPADSILRLINSICGQKRMTELSSSRDKACELPTTLEKLGFRPHFYFNDYSTKSTLSQPLLDIITANGGISSTSAVSKVLYHNAEGSPVYRDRDVLKAVIKRAEAHGGGSFNYIHSASLASNLKLSSDGKSAAYNERLGLFLKDLDEFIDYLEDQNKPCLFILLSACGSANHSDKTQLQGIRKIPSQKLTNTTAMIKFVGINDNHNQKVYNDNVSYQALASAIARIIKLDIFSRQRPLSYDALHEDLYKTAIVSENRENTLIEFKGKFFYKANQNNDAAWKEYVN